MSGVNDIFVVGDVFSFETYAPDVLGARIENVTCLAVMYAQDAINNGLDIFAYHERMRPHLPSGYNDDPMTMTYVKVRDITGIETIYALDWIKPGITRTEVHKVVVTVSSISIGDVENIRSALTQLGYTNISIEIPKT